jgi:hypothetical protein
MLRIDQAQIEAFNIPHWKQLEEQVIQFVQGRPELQPAGDAEFLRAACLQLIPRGRANGIDNPNALCRYVYLSLCLDYRASGQDVCQRLQVPYSNDGLRYAQAKVIEASQKGGTP